MYRLIAVVLGVLQSAGCLTGLQVTSQGVAFLAGDGCVTVAVSGAVHQTVINGRYEVDKTFELNCYSRPVWRQVDSNRTFIYYLEDGFDGWMFGESSCYHWGNFLAGVQSDAQSPSEVTETWKESVPNAGLIESQELSVKCVSWSYACVGKNCGPKGSHVHVKVLLTALILSAIVIGIAVTVVVVIAFRQRKKMRVVEAGENDGDRNTSTLKYKRLEHA